MANKTYKLELELSDGTKTDAGTFTVFDGKDGADGYTPIKGIDYWTAADTAQINADNRAFITAELAKRNQLKPEYAASIEDCTDTDKLYVLPDGFIYAYMETTTSTDETPGYTDLVPGSTERDGSPYNGGLGYKSGYRINSSGQEQIYENRYCTGFIPVTNTDVIRIKNHGTQPGSNNSYIALYKSNFSLASILYSNTENTTWHYDTRPDENGIVTIDLSVFEPVSWMRLGSYPDSEPRMIVAKEDIVMTPGGTETVTTWVNTGLAFIPADYEDRILALESDVVDLKEGSGNAESKENIKFYLPGTLYCSVGRELSLYYPNFTNLTNPENYEFRIRAFTKNHFSVTRDRIRIIPTAAFDLNTFIDVYKNDVLVASQPVRVIAVSEDTIPNINAIFIGDSLTEANYSQSELKNLMGDALTLSGTIVHSRSDANGVSREIKAEGRSGWSTVNYQENSTRNGFTNPFYNPAVNAFDFSYYMMNSGAEYGVITDVFIMLGTNDSLKMGDSYIQTAKSNVAQMMASINQYSSAIRVHIMLLPIFTTDDNSYLYKQNGYGFSMRMESLGVQKLWMEYLSLTDNIVPVALNIDMVNDMTRADVPLSQRNTETVKIVTDTVHPAKTGYFKIADVIFSYILNKCV